MKLRSNYLLIGPHNMKSARWDLVPGGVFLIWVHHVELLHDLPVWICYDRVRNLVP